MHVHGETRVQVTSEPHHHYHGGSGPVLGQVVDVPVAVHVQVDVPVVLVHTVQPAETPQVQFSIGEGPTLMRACQSSTRS